MTHEIVINCSNGRTNVALVLYQSLSEQDHKTLVRVAMQLLGYEQIMDAPDDLIKHPPNERASAENYKFNNSLVRDDLGRAALCSPDIVDCRPKITDRRRPTRHTARSRKPGDATLKQRERFDAITSIKTPEHERTGKGASHRRRAEARAWSTVVS